jgi:hypothetical protein
LTREVGVEVQRDPGSPGEELDRAVVVRRPKSARDTHQVEAEAVAERSLEVGLTVADDDDPSRLDTEAEER